MTESCYECPNCKYRMASANYESIRILALLCPRCDSRTLLSFKKIPVFSERESKEFSEPEEKVS
jgi:ssDNA-binding Zn-finger/Zn-ribbon topoisomerase 1